MEKVNSGLAARNGSIRIEHRKKLPVTTDERKGSHSIILGIIRKFIGGMDITRVSLPISFYCPLSWLQNESERFFSSYLLEKASNCKDPFERFEYVAGFYASDLSRVPHMSKRLQFNLPILGETFELSAPELGFRMVVECICYDPVQTPCFVESIDENGNPNGIFKVYTGGYVDVEFKGTQVETHPHNYWIVEFPKLNEVYVADERLTCFISNFLRGVSKVLIYPSGVSTIERYISSVKDSSRVILASHGPSKGLDLLGGWNTETDPLWWEGHLEAAAGKTLRHFYGSRCKYLHSVPPVTWNKSGERAKLSKQSTKALKKLEGAKVHWARDARLQPQTEYFMLSEYQIGLNELTPGLEYSLPPTDSRCRKDVRLLEQGFTDEAEAAKMEIELKQTKARTKRMQGSNKDSWQARWFKEKNLEKGGDVLYWEFDHSYWNRDWSECPDIFT